MNALLLCVSPSQRPKTDGGKLSLPGVLKVRRDGGRLWVEPRGPHEAHDPATNELRVVYDNGPVAGAWDDFSTVQARVRAQWAITPKQHNPVGPAMQARIADWIAAFDITYAKMMQKIDEDAAAAAKAKEAAAGAATQADQHLAQDIKENKA